MHINVIFCLKFDRTHNTVSHALRQLNLYCVSAGHSKKNELLCNAVSWFVSCIHYTCSSYTCSSGFLHACVGSWALLKRVNCNVVSLSVKILLGRVAINDIVESFHNIGSTRCKYFEPHKCPHKLYSLLNESLWFISKIQNNWFIHQWSIVIITPRLCKILDSTFSVLNSTLFCFDSTFWLDSTLKLNYGSFRDIIISRFWGHVVIYGWQPVSHLFRDTSCEFLPRDARTVSAVCYRKSSVRPSVRDVVVPWAHMLS